MIDAVAWYVVGVIFLATAIRSALGFGEALIAVPLLVLRIPLETAAPLAVNMAPVLEDDEQGDGDRDHHLPSAGWLVAATLPGIPLGLALLTSRHQQAVKLILALVIILFGLYSLLAGRLLELKTDNKAWLLCCGFFAGILGGAYGMNGPPLAIYGTMRRWPPQHFRATLQGYFLPASLLGMAGYWWKGLWGHATTHYYLLALPATIPAIWLGRVANHRLPLEKFRVCVYVGLTAIGAVLAAQALTS